MRASSGVIISSLLPWTRFHIPFWRNGYSISGAVNKALTFIDAACEAFRAIPELNNKSRRCSANSFGTRLSVKSDATGGWFETSSKAEEGSMRPSLNLWRLFTTLLVFSSPAFGQQGFRHVVPPPAPVRALTVHPTPTRLPVAPVIRRISVSSSTSSGNSNRDSSATGSSVVLFDGSPINLDQLLDPSPSFGFDFEHLNAVNPDLAIKALIDPITQQRLALAERLLRETPSVPISFPLFAGQPVVMLEQQPPVIVLQQQPASAPAVQEAAPMAPAPPAAESSAEPLHDVGTFVLVLRDGTKLDAVAFTIQNDHLIYITSDGLRRVIPVSELDKPATEQLNDDRGTPVHLPQ